MGFPTWSDGVSTVQFSVGATLPLVPYHEVERQVLSEDSEGHLQVYDTGTALTTRTRIYQGVSPEEILAFLAFRRKATVNYKGFPVTYTEEDGQQYTVRLMQVDHQQLENGDYTVTVSMREEP